MSQRIPMEGKRFGRLTVLRYSHTNKNKRAFYVCRCDCGKECIIMGKYLRNGDTKSCGCLNIDRVKEMGKNNFIGNAAVEEDGHIRVFFNNADGSFICDKEDWNKSKQYNWYLNNSGYARASINKRMVLFHNFILDYVPDNSKADVCDHISGDKLDNRKSNLRIVSRTQNCINRGRLKPTKHNFPRGVYKIGNKFEAYLTLNHKTNYLGLFNTIDEAVVARKIAEKQYFGEYNRET